MLPPIPRRFLAGSAQSRFVLLVYDTRAPEGSSIWMPVAWPMHGNRGRRIVADFAHHDARGQAAVLLDRQKVEDPVVFWNDHGGGAKMEEVK